MESYLLTIGNKKQTAIKVESNPGRRVRVFDPLRLFDQVMELRPGKRLLGAAAARQPEPAQGAGPEEPQPVRSPVISSAWMKSVSRMSSSPFRRPSRRARRILLHMGLFSQVYLGEISRFLGGGVEVIPRARGAGTAPADVRVLVRSWWWWRWR